MQAATPASIRACCAAAVLAMLVAACGDPAGDGGSTSDLPNGGTPATATAPPALPPIQVAPATARHPNAGPGPAASAPPAQPPYTFIGKWTAAGRTVAYLKHGEHTVAVTGPGPLDARYAVQSLDAHRLVLIYLPLGSLHTIDIDAVPDRALAQAAAVTSPALPTPANPQTPGNSSDSQQPDN